jgi:hypothetical protein
LWILILLLFDIIGLLLKLVKYDLEKKHSCLIFCNQTKTVQFLQHFFRDQRIEILAMYSQMTDTVSSSTILMIQKFHNQVFMQRDVRRVTIFNVGMVITVFVIAILSEWILII